MATAPISIDAVFRGVLVRTSQLDVAGYLDTLGSSVAAEEPGVTLALADRDQVLHRPDGQLTRQ